MSKKTIVILILLFTAAELKAQSGAQYSYYVFNSFYLNPGAAGITNKTTFQANLRSQYLGYAATTDLGGNAQSTVLSADMPVNKLKGGLGIYFSNDNFTKVQTNQNVQVSYSFHKKLINNILGLGVSVGMMNKKFNGDIYRPRDENDPLVPTSVLNVQSPSINIGAFLYNPNYQLGLSVKNITQNGYKINNLSGVSKDLRQYYVTGKTNIGISYMIDLSPMLIIKSDLKTVSTELGLMGTYNQKYWVGLNYRWQDAASVLIGGDLLRNTLKIGYAIDLITFGQQAKSASSHEIFLRYNLTPPKIGKKSVIKTPRYSF